MFTTLEQRMAGLWMALAELYGRQKDGEIAVDYPLTRRFTARAVAGCERSVVLVMLQWRKRGIWAPGQL